MLSNPKAFVADKMASVDSALWCQIVLVHYVGTDNILKILFRGCGWIYFCNTDNSNNTAIFLFLDDMTALERVSLQLLNALQAEVTDKRRIYKEFLQKCKNSTILPESQCSNFKEGTALLNQWMWFLTALIIGQLLEAASQVHIIVSVITCDMGNTISVSDLIIPSVIRLYVLAS